LPAPAQKTGVMRHSAAFRRYDTPCAGSQQLYTRADFQFRWRIFENTPHPLYVTLHFCKEGGTRRACGWQGNSGECIMLFRQMTSVFTKNSSSFGEFSVCFYPIRYKLSL
jgi:hypothetical protein